MATISLERFFFILIGSLNASQMKRNTVINNLRLKSVDVFVYTYRPPTQSASCNVQQQSLLTSRGSMYWLSVYSIHLLASVPSIYNKMIHTHTFDRK